uniref:Nitrate regulatory gene2 protein-like n=1 Tax=Tanacetum cinerariifolium TaxID=118510 RepID=A0A6L2KIF7_TANCI|nr:nitrate regulatory gene2 protein-like [Tanacetum cinerariifolium]
MGCVGSKPLEKDYNSSPAVILCRKRCEFLDEAIHQRYILSQAHFAYFTSLKTLTNSLTLFFNHHPTSSSFHDDVTTTSKAVKDDVIVPTHKKTNSVESHIRFGTDSDDDSDGSLHLHDDSHGGAWRESYPPASAWHETYPLSDGYTMSYMVKQVTPSVMYQQKPSSSEPIYYSDHQNPSIYTYNSNYSNYGEFFGQPMPAVAAEVAESSKPPPPPPVAEASSGWDFFNPFESYESFYPPYIETKANTISRGSSIVREEEGIPDLEDDIFYKKNNEEEEVVDKKVVENEAKKAEEKELPNVVEKAKQSDPVDKEVVVEEDQKKKGAVYSNDSDVVKEISAQFDRASECGNELAKILEVGKVPHNRKHVVYQVPSKMLNVFTPSLALAPADPDTLDTDVDLLTKSKNLSSTLHKLYLWEKKLFDEVKIEEKMRLLHDEKKRKLSRMDEKGAEPHKIDATRTFVRSLSTKIRIAIQVVDKISDKINKLRDEELWPQLNDFIEGITGMWRMMVECHHSQCEAIHAAKGIDAIAYQKHSSDASLEATLQLEHELLNWAIRFSCWFGAQKGFVRALNEWLLKCLMYEPEETVDGPVPYSPGRIGAPAIFIVCNQWAQAMQRISDKEVVDSMRDFAATVLQLWERDKGEMRQRMVVDKNMERNVKNLDKEDQKIHKELQMLDKMIVVASGDDDKGMSLGHAVYQSETSKNGSLQTSLQRVFESLERFTSMSLKAYEELLQRIEQDKLA